MQVSFTQINNSLNQLKTLKTKKAVYGQNHINSR